MDQKTIGLVLVVAIVGGVIGSYMIFYGMSNGDIIQVRINTADWTPQEATVEVENIGNVPAIIESLKVRRNDSSTWYVDVSNDATGSIPVGEVKSLIWSPSDADAVGVLEPGVDYVIRVECATGESHELVSSPNLGIFIHIRIDGIAFDVDADTVDVMVRNIGAFATTITSVSVNSQSKTVSEPLAVGQAVVVQWTGTYDIRDGVTYTIRVSAYGRTVTKTATA